MPLPLNQTQKSSGQKKSRFSDKNICSSTLRRRRPPGRGSVSLCRLPAAATHHPSSRIAIGGGKKSFGRSLPGSDSRRRDDGPRPNSFHCYGTRYTVHCSYTTAIFLRLVPSVLFLRLGEKEKKRDGGGRGGSERRKLSLPPFWPLRQEKCRIVAKISLRYLLRSLAAAEGGGGSPSRVLEGEKESR